MKPSIGVAMTTYNGDLYVEKQIDSILRQTVKPDVIVISDDASTDRTQEIIDRYAVKNQNIKIHLQPGNVGFTKNFETAISLCNTDIILISDQDNIWDSAKIQTCADFLKQNPGAGLCYHDAHLILSDDRRIEYTFRDLFPGIYPLENYRAKKMLMDVTFANPGFTLAFDGRLRKRIIPFPDFRVCSYDWWINVAAFFLYQPVPIDASLMYFRLHDRQVGGAINLLRGTKYGKKKILDVRRFIKNVEVNYNHLFKRKKINALREQYERDKKFDVALAMERVAMFSEDGFERDNGKAMVLKEGRAVPPCPQALNQGSNFRR